MASLLTQLHDHGLTGWVAVGYCQRYRSTKWTTEGRLSMRMNAEYEARTPWRPKVQGKVNDGTAVLMDGA